MTETLNKDGNLVNTPGTIWTFTGGTIEPLNPNVADIDIRDIAHALSFQCRFTGHTNRFYSVAEHSLLCAAAYPNDDLRLTLLLHDASEAYLSDIARPVKHAPEFKEFYHEAEVRLEEAIAEKFGLEYPWPEAVKIIDDAMLGREIYELMPESLRERWPSPATWTPIPQCWTPGLTEHVFIDRFLDYGGKLL